MGLLKYFLLFLTVYGVCNGQLRDKCTTTGVNVSGRRTQYKVSSIETSIPAGVKTPLQYAVILSNTVCQQTSRNFLVGHEVIGCETDVAPTVKYLDPQGTRISVIRNGLALYDGSVYTIYYCDNFP